jgi:hypothetical protein
MELPNWKQQTVYRVLLPRSRIVDMNHEANIDSVQLAEILCLFADHVPYGKTIMVIHAQKTSTDDFFSPKAVPEELMCSQSRVGLGAQKKSRAGGNPQPAEGSMGAILFPYHHQPANSNTEARPMTEAGLHSRTAGK